MMLKKSLLAVFVLASLLNSEWTSANGTGFYTGVEFTGIKGELLANVQANVHLARALNSKEKLSSGQWQRLRQGAQQEIKEALKPFGYYRARIDVDDSSDHLVYKIQLSEPVRIRSLDIELVGPASEMAEYKSWQEGLNLELGAVLIQPHYEDAKRALQALNLRFGYFDAHLSEHRILIDEAKLNADVTLKMQSHDRYRLGSISLSWQDGERVLTNKVLNPYLKVVSGKPYDANELASTQTVLQSTRYFSAVEVRPELENLKGGVVPIKVLLSPQKPHAVNFTFGAGTDTGLRGSIGYANRLLNSGGHNLSLRLGTSDIRRTAMLNYRIPQPTAIRDSVNLLAALEEEDNDFRKFTVQKLGAELLKEWRDGTLKFGLLGSREKFLVGDIEQTTDLVMPSIGWQKVVSNDPYNPNYGWSADVALKGSSAALGSDLSLLQLVVDAKAILPVFSGRVLTRLNAAATDLDNSRELPASLGFLTGGDHSVRGYRYESIGVSINSVDGRGISSGSLEDGLTVGRHLLVASIEYEHPLKKQFGLAAFFDVGDAFDNHVNLKRGAGVGLRWRLPFGALRLDVASALDRQGDPLRLHLSFGSVL